ncbi:hypothetical protein SEVIR_6G201133v4 [Setaria viridis]
MPRCRAPPRRAVPTVERAREKQQVGSPGDASTGGWWRGARVRVTRGGSAAGGLGGPQGHAARACDTWTGASPSPSRPSATARRCLVTGFAMLPVWRCPRLLHLHGSELSSVPCEILCGSSRCRRPRRTIDTSG